MRRLDHPVTVLTDSSGRPRAVDLGGGRRPVREILDRWLEAGRWWEGEAPHRFYRIEAGGRFDLSCDEQGEWRVRAVWD